MVTCASGAAARRACAVALAAVATAAAASATYTVNVDAELNGLDVKITTVENSGGLIVRLTNDTPHNVRCTVRLDAQPKTPARKTVYVAPGSTEEAAFAAQRKWFDVDVRVACAPESK